MTIPVGLNNAALMVVTWDAMRRIWQGVTVIALLTVAIHAFVPMKASAEPVSGSVFSAFTSDVAIGFSHRTEVEKKFAPAEPEPPVLIESDMARAEFVDDSSRRFASWPRSIGPPSCDTTCLPLNPRAPPIT